MYGVTLFAVSKVKLLYKRYLSDVRISVLYKLYNMAYHSREVRHAFHQNHGEITLSDGNTVAEWTGLQGLDGTWCTVFSRDPVGVSETFTVKLTQPISVSNDVQTYCIIHVTLLSVIDIEIDIVKHSWWLIGLYVNILLWIYYRWQHS